MSDQSRTPSNPASAASLPSPQAEALRASEMRLRLATEAAQMFAWDVDVATDAIVWSDNAATIIGCRPDELPATIADNGALFFVAEDERARVMRDYAEALER